MNNITKFSLYGLIFGMLGTSIGGLLGSIGKKNSNKFICFILELSAGLMNAIICFDLIPKSILTNNLSLTLLGIFLGIIFMGITQKIIQEKTTSYNNDSLFLTGIIISIGLAIHNIPEGLAIGAGFNSSSNLGFKLAIAIAIHDIPEGITISLPLKTCGMNSFKAFLIASISGLTTGVGSLIGSFIGNISETFIGLSLSFAAGTMLYIIACELIPESKKLYIGKITSIGFIIGICLGIISLRI